MEGSAIDYRDLPAYTVAEVAKILHVVPSTIRYWATGYRNHRPVIEIPGSQHRPTLLSFFNLAELHVVTSIRRIHMVTLPKVRRSIDFLVNIATELKVQNHPLLSYEMQTDGIDMFVQYVDTVMINASREGQQEMRPLMDAVFQRIRRDEDGHPFQLYPFTNSTITMTNPGAVVIDPRLSGGLPVLAESGICTRIIADRHVTGESIRQLACDYGLKDEDIEEALRWELAS